MKASRVFSPLIDETDATRADGLMNSPPLSLSRSISQYICSYYPKNIFVPYPFQSYSFVMIDARFSKITLDFPRCERFKWIMLYDLFSFCIFSNYEIWDIDFGWKNYKEESTRGINFDDMKGNKKNFA